METLLFLFGSAFIVGLSGAMMPGPVLTATISEVLKRGWTAGPLIILGHGLLELTVLMAVVFGFGTWITQPTILAFIGIGGGTILLWMGLQMMVTSKAAAREAADTEADPRTAIRGPILTGILTSASNPYFSLWWATIGLTYAAHALKSGAPGLIAFYSGHILSDLSWYTIISLAVASGRRRFCRPEIHRWLIVLCGLILMALGMFFLSGALGALA